MRDHPDTPPLQTDLASDPRWQLVQRIADSPQFQKSARLRDFLTYVAGEAIHGRTGELSEHHIGCRVFERRPDYSPADDNIVRVHARQLRIRLEEYFLLTGRDEPLLLEIPKGSYVPVFHERPAPPSPLPAPADPVRADLLAPVRRPSKVVFGIMAALALLSVALLVQNWNLRHPSAALPWLLAAVLDPVETTTVVIPDSGFGALRSTIGNTPPLTDYLEPGYPNGLVRPGINPRDEHWIRVLTARPYTTFPMAVIAAGIAQYAERFQRKVAFRFARDLNSRDLHEGRFILLGSSIANPWVSLFENQLNFRADWDPVADRTMIRNLSPQAGEQAVYLTRAANAVPGESFAAISLLVNRDGARGNGAARVLIVQGANVESTEAGAEFALDARMSQEALRSTGATPPAAPAGYRFEAVVKTRAVTGASRDTSLVAARYSGDRARRN